MKTKMKFDEYYKKIRMSGFSHAYIKQDYGYDEYGNFYLMHCHKLMIIKNDEFLYKRELMFKSFEECEEIAILKCKELGVELEYVVVDKNSDDDTVSVRKFVG